MTDLAAIRTVWERATKGPYRAVPWHIAEGPSQVRATEPEDYLLCEVPSDDQAEFFAASWSYVRDLLALAARLEQENKELREAAERWNALV